MAQIARPEAAVRHLGRPTNWCRIRHVRRRYRLFGVAAVAHAWTQLQAASSAAASRSTSPSDSPTAMPPPANSESASAAIRRGLARLDSVQPRGVLRHPRWRSIFAGYDAAEHAWLERLAGPIRTPVVANSTPMLRFFRDIFGNPFRPVTSTRLAHRDRDGAGRRHVRLARLLRHAHSRRRTPGRGCDSDDILDHCREPT